MAEKEDVLTKTYDLLMYLIPQLAKFPRGQKYILADRVETQVLDILEGLVEAYYSEKSAKRPLLVRINLQLEKLRFLIRLSHDLHFFSNRHKTSTAVFNINLEKELPDLREALIQQTYSPGPYTEFTIYDPKKRKISAAPYRDRVVHHALCNVIEPIFENIFIYDSYANRKGKGTHKAILRYQEFCRKNHYVLKCDVQKYFPSIDFEILKTEIRRKISCRKTLWLIDTIIDHSNAQEDMFAYFPGDDLFTPWERRRGLPIGNLTSQFFANIYLNSFDHFIKETLQCKYYLRYVDDFAIFHNDKTALRRIKNESIDFLETYRLKLHQKKTRIYRCDEGLCFLGHRIFPDFRLLKKDNVIRFRRKLIKLKEEYANGAIDLKNVHAAVQGWIGHASFSNTYRLRCKIFSEFALKRDKLDAPPCSPRRFVEQQ